MNQIKVIIFVVVLIVVSVSGYLIYSKVSNAPGATSTSTTIKNGGVGSALSGIAALIVL